MTPDEHFGVPDPNTTPVREDASLSWPPDSRLAQGPVLKGSFGAQGHDINAVKEVDLLEGGSYPMKNSYSSPGSGLCSSEGLPLTSTDAELVQMSTLKDPGAEQQSENARVLPQPREVQENHLEHLDQETDDGKELGGSGLTAAITHAHGFTPPTSEEDAGRRSSEDNARYEDNQPPPTGKLKSKLDIGGAEIIGGTESTPDEQLRLEEAQSLMAGRSQDQYHHLPVFLLSLYMTAWWMGPQYPMFPAWMTKQLQNNMSRLQTLETSKANYQEDPQLVCEITCALDSSQTHRRI